MTRIAISTAPLPARNRHDWLVLLVTVLMTASAFLYNGVAAHADRSSGLDLPATDARASITVEHDHCGSLCDAGDQTRQQGDDGWVCLSGCLICVLSTAEAPIDVLQRELLSVRPGPALREGHIAPRLKPPRRIVIV